jgi:Restriction endonuclease
MTAILLQQLGNAANRVPPAATAFAHRDARWDGLLLTSWEDAAQDASQIEWAREAWRTTAESVLRRLLIRAKPLGGPNFDGTGTYYVGNGGFAALYDNPAKDNYVRGKQFERVCKWYLQNNPYYRDAVRQVWLWDDWEYKWGADAGIDLVVEDHDGHALECAVESGCLGGHLEGSGGLPPAPCSPGL